MGLLATKMVHPEKNQAKKQKFLPYSPCILAGTKILLFYLRIFHRYDRRKKQKDSACIGIGRFSVCFHRFSAVSVFPPDKNQAPTVFLRGMAILSMPGTSPRKIIRNKRRYRLIGTSSIQLYFCDLCQVQISCDLCLWKSVISHRTIVTPPLF